MADLVVIVPSRGRPEAAVELVQAFADTCTADTFLAFAVDDNDPTRERYGEVCDGVRSGTLILPSRTMVEALNMTAGHLPSHQAAFAVGFMGDDHRPRTVGWDKAYLDALRELGTGIVYGDDLLQGENLPTECAMTSDIVRALGYMAPPTLTHMYVDNFWLDLGQAAGCLRYLPDVVVEHMHPVAGKAEWTDGHKRVNDAAVYDADQRAYGEYRASGRLAADTAAVAALCGGIRHEWRLFDEGTVPEYTTPEWYEGREHAPHLEQPGHRERLMQTAAYVAQAAFGRGLRTVVDLGAGDGGLLSLLGPAFRAWGYDLMPANVAAAKERGVDVRLGDVIGDAVDWADIAVCTEMLEHLVDPHDFVRAIAENCRALVCSSPADERPGRAYEYHTWCWDEAGYRALVEQAGFVVKAHRRVNRFQVLMAVRADA